MKTIYVGFKGEANSSCRIVSLLAGDRLFLTNSFAGLARDLAALPEEYGAAVMFGLDKSLRTIRVERCAVRDGILLASAMDPEGIAERLRGRGADCAVGESPFPSLCNEAYWLALKKYGGNAVFLHLPSWRRMTGEMIRGILGEFC